MATSQSWQQEPNTRQSGSNYPYPEQDPSNGRDGSNGKIGQVVGNLRRVWQRAQERTGWNDRQPSTTLNTELRQGQQEVLSIGRDVASIAQDLQVLVQQEMLLARAEIVEQIRLSTKALVWSGVALTFMFLAVAFLAVGGMFAIALEFPLWVAALITAGALLFLGFAAGIIAYWYFRQIHVVPQQAMESVKENVKWLSDQLRYNGT